MFVISVTLVFIDNSSIISCSKVLGILVPNKNGLDLKPLNE